MYIAGRLRTASRPSRTLILSAEYSATPSALPWPLLPAGTSGVCAGLVPDVGSLLMSVKSALQPHRHDHVGVLVPLRPDRRHHRLADLVLEVEGDGVGRDHCKKVADVLRVEADL